MRKQSYEGTHIELSASNDNFSQRHRRHGKGGEEWGKIPSRHSIKVSQRVCSNRNVFAEHPGRLI